MKKDVNTDGNNKKRKNIAARVFTCLVVLILLLCFCFYQNCHIVISSYKCESTNLPEEFDGFRIVQISDFHNVHFSGKNAGLINMIEDCSPDIIVLTGDLVDSLHTDVECAVQFVRDITPIAPVYYVTGNHEYLLKEADFMRLMDGMKDAGVNLLFNDIVSLEREGAFVNLIGLDENALGLGVLKNLVNSSDCENGYKVVLAHEPQYINNYAQANADIVFSGHAHGGQIILPFVGALYAPGQGMFPEYTEGVHVMGNTQLVISRGIGNSLFPVRVFNYPEIVTVELQNK